MLGLMLCLISCEPSISPEKPAVAKTAQGNAYRLRLPAACWIVFSSKSDAEAFRAVAVNETKPGPNATTLITTKELEVVSTSYIENRDETEVQLNKMIDTQKAIIQDKAAK